MTVPSLAAARLGPPAAHLPLLVVGPSLGTSVTALWDACATQLAGRYDVVGWELPGHGLGAPATAAFSIAELAAGVRSLGARVSAERGRPGEAFEYAGDSIGGAVGLQLALDAPDRVLAVTALCTGARIGEPSGWHERAAQVRSQGTASLVAASAGRWFAPGFFEREPVPGGVLLNVLRDCDDESYALACEALAEFDLIGRLGEITAPVTAVAGAADVVCPRESLQVIADGVEDGHVVVLDGVAHLAPVEAPAAVAQLIANRPQRSSEVLAAGFAVRRAVLGDAHVDRSLENSTELTAPFQEFITRYAWGSVWTRAALSRRERSLMTLTALIAGGHLEELALHTRAAIRNGLTGTEIAECVLHSAIYCGVPAANSALRVVQQTLQSMEGTADQ